MPKSATDFKQPDLHAKRFTKKTKDFPNKELFEKFKEKYPEYQDKTYMEFKNAILTVNRSLWRAALDHRDGIELPESLGSVFVGACMAPKIRSNVDFGRSRKLGYKVRHQNHETDGKISKIFYTNYAQKYNFNNRQFWKFTADRTFARTTSKEFKLDWKRFHEIPSDLRVRLLYRKHVVRDVMRNLTKKALKHHNEFDLE